MAEKTSEHFKHLVGQKMKSSKKPSSIDRVSNNQRKKKSMQKKMMFCEGEIQHKKGHVKIISALLENFYIFVFLGRNQCTLFIF
jgi:hypothetical protein